MIPFILNVTNILIFKIFHFIFSEVDNFLLAFKGVLMSIILNEMMELNNNYFFSLYTELNDFLRNRKLFEKVSPLTDCFDKCIHFSFVGGIFALNCN